MHGVARAPAAISVVNAIPAGRGAAVAIDRAVTARVELDPTAENVTGAIGDGRDVDTTLIERCVAATTAAYGDGEGGTVETAAEVPPSVGLKSSSAAANAAIAATLDALGRWDDIDNLTATRLGVEVARDVGVTVTGAFDDATASMLGGLVVTDNTDDEVLHRDDLTGPVVLLLPDSRRPTATVDTDALDAVAPLGALAADTALEGRYGLAMTVNGLAVATALDLDIAPLRAAMAHTTAVSPSGTGPAVAAIADADACDAIAEAWSPFGDVLETELSSVGTTVG